MASPLALGALGFLSSCLYWPGVAGAATTPRWALLLVVCPLLLRRQPFTPAHGWGSLFIAWAALSILWSQARRDTVGAFVLLALGGVMFAMGNGIRDMRPVYIGAGLGLAVSGAVAIAQVAGFHPVDGWGYSGLYVNGNLMAEAAALVMVAAVVRRLWWLAALVAPALILPGSRAALAAAGVALALHYRAHWRVMVPAAVAIAGVVLWLTAWKLGSAAITGRIELWGSTFMGVNLTGHGLGSFWQVFPDFDMRSVPDAMPEYAHHELLHIGFELGVVGVVLFIMFCDTLVGPLTCERLVLVALFVESCFGYPIHMPTTAFLGALAAGHAVRGLHAVRTGDDRRRKHKSAWVEAGQL